VSAQGRLNICVHTHVYHRRYLVQRVIPMLPRLLCEELCSLHPGYPRFAFSIVWEVDEDGNIYKEWAGRSVISSRAKLAYPMVQQMIEGCFDPAPWGVQLHERATWEEVRGVLLTDCASVLCWPLQPEGLLYACKQLAVFLQLCCPRGRHGWWFVGAQYSSPTA
jgi:hypothetical protein